MAVSGEDASLDGVAGVRATRPNNSRKRLGYIHGNLQRAAIMSYKLNQDSQKLQDLFEQTRVSKHWARIYCKKDSVFHGRGFEGYADCWTYTTIGDDEDVDAMRFIRRDGTGYTVAGVDIDHFEVLEPRT